jgi:hypothetical protein
MSFNDGEMQVVSILGAAILTAALGVPVAYLTEKAAPDKTKLEDMEPIEASIAYKKDKPKEKQPQKPTSQPVVQKDEGVSHDENKKQPDQCKADADCKPDESCKSGKCIPKATKVVKATTCKTNADCAGGECLLGSCVTKRGSENDNDPGAPPPKPGGEFNGEEYGFASVTKGAPYWQKFVRDIHENFSLPTISDANGAPVGCFHITADGKIVDTKIKEKSDSPDLDQAAEHAIDAVKKLRNDNPDPVPTELLGQTTRWICFRFDPNKI